MKRQQLIVRFEYLVLLAACLLCFACAPAGWSWRGQQTGGLIPGEALTADSRTAGDVLSALGGGDADAAHAPAALGGQETCHTYSAVSHGNWHVVEEQKEQIRSSLLGQGVDPRAGFMTVWRERGTNALVARSYGFDLPSSMDDVLDDLLKDFGSGVLHSLDFDGEPVPTWSDSTRDCWPVLLNREEVLDAIEESLSRPADSNGRDRVRVNPWILVDEAGAVRAVSLGGAHGAERPIDPELRDLEPSLSQVMSKGRYRPGERNGVPTSMWIEQPITLLVRQPL